jgi:hypothetical protein
MMEAPADQVEDATQKKPVTEAAVDDAAPKRTNEETHRYYMYVGLGVAGAVVIVAVVVAVVMVRMHNNSGSGSDDDHKPPTPNPDPTPPNPTPTPPPSFDQFSSWYVSGGGTEADAKVAYTMYTWNGSKEKWALGPYVYGARSAVINGYSQYCVNPKRATLSSCDAQHCLDGTCSTAEADFQSLYTGIMIGSFTLSFCAGLASVFMWRHHRKQEQKMLEQDGTTHVG